MPSFGRHCWWQGLLGALALTTAVAASGQTVEIKEITTQAAGQDPLVNAHRDMALATLFGLAFTGVGAWIELWRYRYLGRFSTRSLYTVLTFAVITLAIMAETGHRGGQINHPEIRTEAVPTDLTGRATLGRLDAIIHQLDLVIGNESGPAYMAQATGTPRIS